MAVLLAMIIKSKYPDVKVYAFATPGILPNARIIKKTKNTSIK